MRSNLAGPWFNVCVNKYQMAIKFGENSGDPVHAEPHFRTASHYQSFE